MLLKDASKVGAEAPQQWFPEGIQLDPLVLLEVNNAILVVQWQIRIFCYLSIIAFVSQFFLIMFLFQNTGNLRNLKICLVLLTGARFFIHSSALIFCMILRRLTRGTWLDLGSRRLSILHIFYGWEENFWDVVATFRFQLLRSWHSLIFGCEYWPRQDCLSNPKLSAKKLTTLQGLGFVLATQICRCPCIDQHSPDRRQRACDLHLFYVCLF